MKRIKNSTQMIIVINERTTSNELDEVAMDSVLGYFFRGLWVMGGVELGNGEYVWMTVKDCKYE